MKTLPSGLGLAFLALAVAASVPVGGCRGESPVQVIRSESSGVGELKSDSQTNVPVELQQPHDSKFSFRLSNYVNVVIVALEAPIDKSATRLGLIRAATPIKHGDHLLESISIELLLFGNGTKPLLADSWDAKVLASTGVSVLPQDSESRMRLEPMAKEAATHYQAGYREPLYWREDIGLVEARPVILKDATCLNCHTSGKVGDVAGVVIARLSPDEVKQIDLRR